MCGQKQKGGGAVRWDRAWQRADAALIHNRYSISLASWVEFWDVKAAAYEDHETRQESVRADVIRYLARAGLLVPGDRVLDVGCGPGTYTVHLARICGETTGLDISSEMLNRMSEKSAASGFVDIRSVRSPWESFSTGDIYDLVFSAFCPAIRSRETLLKMALHSRRGCCYLTGGSICQPGAMTELHESLTGRRYEPDRNWEFFSFNVLYEMGLRPDVRPFRLYYSHPPDPSWLEKTYLDYFSMFLEIGDKEASIIRQYVQRHEKEEEPDPPSGYGTFYVVTWQVPSAERNGESLARFMAREGLVRSGDRVLNASGLDVVAEIDECSIITGKINAALPLEAETVISMPFHGSGGIDSAEQAASRTCCVLCTETEARYLFNLLYDDDRAPGIKFGLHEGTLVWWQKSGRGEEE
ncbi:MAG TPA: methyltransferase domain-containing protein [Methanocella sp.]|nr:methyltransferase domain-containing protein [Methanocella sp.]